MTLTTLLSGLLAAYLLGAIPSAALIARLRREDIFDVGSGNMGTMNTARNLGYALGGLVLALDVGKGFAASYLGLVLSSGSDLGSGQALLVPLAFGVAAVIGHAWSVFVGFRGGKALATAFGVALPLYPLAAVLTLFTLIGLVYAFKDAHRASVVGATLYPALTFIALYLTGAAATRVFWTVSATVGIACIIVVKHLFPANGR